MLIGSAAKVKLGDRNLKLPTPEQWQTEAYGFRRTVPEIGFATTYVKNKISQIRLYVGFRPAGSDPNAMPIDVATTEWPDGVEEPPPTVKAIALAELERLKGGAPTHAPLLRRIAPLFDLVGECYLIGVAERPGSGPVPTPIPERWFIASTSEVHDDGAGNVMVKKADVGGKDLKLDPATDAVIRLFIQDDEFMSRASAPMEYLIYECRSLQVLTQQVWAESSSRLSAGILLVANELSPGPEEPSLGEDGENAEEDPFVNAMVETLTTPMLDASSTASVVPTIFRVPNEYIKDGVRWMSFARDNDAKLDERIQKRVERLARGIDLPVEVVMGHAETTFSNAAQIDIDIYEDHLAPRAAVIVESLTVGFFRPQLLGNPAFPIEWATRLELAIDPQPLISQPNQDDNADGAWDRLAISDESYRKARGFSEDDAPTPLEMALRIAMKGAIRDPAVIAVILNALLEPDGIQVPIPAVPALPNAPGSPPATVPGETESPKVTPTPVEDKTPPAPTPPAKASLKMPAPIALPAAVAPRRTLGARLAGIDRELRTRVQVAAHYAMERALEKAGARLKARPGAVRAALANVAPRYALQTLVAAGLGLSDASYTLDQLLDDAFTSLQQQYMEWGAAAQAEAMAAVSEAVGGFSVAERNLLGLRQSSNLAESWTWLEGALTSLAHGKIWAPDEVGNQRGEFDPSLSVPPGLIRNALAIAGGSTDVGSYDDAGAWIAVPGEGGLAAGDDMLGAYGDNGGQVDAYQWEYGNSIRKTPFQPHEDLDGVVFDSFDSDVLANNEGFPESDFFWPGDHEGCCCDFVPVTVDPSEL